MDRVYVICSNFKTKSNKIKTLITNDIWPQEPKHSNDSIHNIYSLETSRAKVD